MTIQDALELIEPAPRVSLAKQIEDEFAPYEAKFEEWRDKSDMIMVNSIDDVEAMAMAKTLERFVGKALSSLEKRRKELKAESLEVGRAIDSAAKRFKEVLEPLREELKAKAEFKERLEQKLLEDKRMYRRNSMLQYGVTLDAQMITMSDEEFEEILSDAKTKYERDLEIEQANKERTNLLLSTSLIRFLSADGAKAIGSMSEQEFAQLQEDLKQKLELEQEQVRLLQESAHLYKKRISLIQEEKIANYIGNHMTGIGTMQEHHFQAMITLALNKKIMHETEQAINKERTLRIKDFNTPSYINTNELYLYSEQEFELLIEHLIELKDVEVVSKRRHRMIGLVWDINDESLLDMSEQDFDNELYERRMKLKQENDVANEGSDRQKLIAFIEWLKTNPNNPNLTSDNGLTISLRINGWFAHMAHRLNESLENL